MVKYLIFSLKNWSTSNCLQAKNVTRICSAIEQVKSLWCNLAQIFMLVLLFRSTEVLKQCSFMCAARLCLEAFQALVRSIYL